jgi:hypothetical protein
MLNKHTFDQILFMDQIVIVYFKAHTIVANESFKKISQYKK